MGKTFFILLITILTFYGCKNDNGVSPHSNIMGTPASNAKYFYSAECVFDGIDSTDGQKYYEFQLKIQFKKDSNGLFPKIPKDHTVINPKDSVEMNACNVCFGKSLLYMDSIGGKMIDVSIDEDPFRKDDIFLDSLIFIKDSLEKNYLLKVSKEKVDKFSGENKNGQLYLRLLIFIGGGYITNETNFEDIQRKLWYVTSGASHFNTINKKLTNSKFGL